MPIRKTNTKKGTHSVLKNMSFENLVTAWLMCDGWQVFTPELDNGHKTDVLISDGPNFYRLQIKTIEAKSEFQKLQNLWKDSELDFVVAFARNSTWGYVMKAFGQNERALNAEGHMRFEQKKNSFLKAFHKL